MTDMQVKYMQAQTEQAKHEETKRANQQKEMLTDLENLAKYGYVAYAPGTEQGDWVKRNVYGYSNLPFDLIGKIGKSFSPIGNLIGSL